MDRKLATIQKIDEILPIDGADNIELAKIKGWQAIVKKGKYKSGDLVIYCEIDSFLPIREEYEFLRKSSYKKMGSEEGFRIRTMKLKGVLSQGLILFLNVPTADGLPIRNFKVGEDVTDILKIKKYDPPIPACLSGKVRGNFPSFIPKTDEERIQNIFDEVKIHFDKEWYVTEKLDGSSATFYHNEGHFGVCSRNLELIEDENNSFWKFAKRLQLETKLKELGNIAIQGELIGEGIQGNPYNINGQDVFFFTVFDIDKQIRLKWKEAQLILSILGCKTVPEVSNLNSVVDFKEVITPEIFLREAERKSALFPNVEQEGLVYRQVDSPNISFKVISNKFLLRDEK